MTNDELEREYSPKAAQRSQERAEARRHQKPIADPRVLAAHAKRLNDLLGNPPPRRRRRKTQ